MFMIIALMAVSSVSGITITENKVEIAVKISGIAFRDISNEACFPTNQLIQSPDEAHPSWVQMDYSTSDSATTLKHEFAQVRTGDNYDSASAKGVMKFTTQTDSTYKVFGSYMASWYAQFWGIFTDLTTGVTLYHSAQSSQRDSEYDLNFGESEGTVYNHLKGSSSGLLQAGHLYQFSWEADIIAVLVENGQVCDPTYEDGGGRAKGFVTLEIGEGSVQVPDTGGTLVLLSIALAFVVASRALALKAHAQ